ADVGLDAAGDQVRDVIGQQDALDLRLLLENRHARLEIRRLDVREESPLEAGAEALLEVPDFLRRGGGRHHELVPRVVEVVEVVEYLVVGAPVAGDEVDVVDEEEIDGAVLGAKLGCAVVADGVDEVVREPLRREIEQAKLWIEPRDLVTDSVQQVSLAQT